MADEVLKLIVTADPTKVLVTLKEVEAAANKIAAANQKATQSSAQHGQTAAGMYASIMQSANVMAQQMAGASSTTASGLMNVGQTAGGVSQSFASMGISGSSALTALGGPMAVVTGAILLQATAIGAFNTALVDAGITFHDVMATMAGRTGATGRVLDELGNSFLKVFAGVPQSAGEVSQVMTLLHQRFSLTGKSLEDISRRVLDFSRVTGTPLKATLQGVVDVFSSWDIQVKDMPKAFDMMLVATNKSGIEVGKLTGLLESNDAVLKQMGFGFTESIALITEFEKRGVGTEKVLMGMNRAMSSLAKAGFDPSDAFQRIVASIRTLDEQHARLLTIQVFGTRAAAEFFDTIRSGQFSIGDMVDELIRSQGALDKAARSSRTLKDEFNQRRMLPLLSSLHLDLN